MKVCLKCCHNVFASKNIPTFKALTLYATKFMNILTSEVLTQVA